MKYSIIRRQLRNCISKYFSNLFSIQFQFIFKSFSNYIFMCSSCSSCSHWHALSANEDLESRHPRVWFAAVTGAKRPKLYFISKYFSNLFSIQFQFIFKSFSNIYFPWRSCMHWAILWAHTKSPNAYATQTLFYFQILFKFVSIQFKFVSKVSQIYISHEDLPTCMFAAVTGAKRPKLYFISKYFSNLFSIQFQFNLNLFSHDR